MRVLSIASQKGGVGKTTVALNIAYAMAVRSWRVLLVDVDPQGAIGLSLNRRVMSAPGLSHILLSNASVHDLIIQTHVRSLALLPVGQVSFQARHDFEDAILHHGGLSHVVDQCQGRFDLIIFDTPAGFTHPTLGALRSSTHVISPLQAEPVAIRTVPRFLDWIGGIRQNGFPVKLAGIILTMLQMHNKHSLHVAEELWNRFPEDIVLEPAVPRDPVFLQASVAGVPLGLLRRIPPPVAKVFDDLAAKLELRLDLEPLGNWDEPLPFVD